MTSRGVLVLTLGSALAAPLACTQILGVEEGRFEGAGGAGGGPASSGPVGPASSNSTTASTASSSSSTGGGCPNSCDDGKECTTDVCTDGVCENDPVPLNTPCGAGLQCDAAGNCVGCTEASQCGVDTLCATYTCRSGRCMTELGLQGTVVGDPTAGDCLHDECDGLSPEPVATAFADPPNDTQPCSNPGCTLDGPFDFPDPNETGDTCGPQGAVCERNGSCSDCTVDNDCMGSGYGTNCLSGVCGCNTSADCQMRWTR